MQLFMIMEQMYAHEYYFKILYVICSIQSYCHENLKHLKSGERMCYQMSNATLRFIANPNRDRANCTIL